MKKILLSFLIILFCSNVYAVDVLYRVSSGEVRNISNSIRSKLPYEEVVTDPTFIDGIDFLDANGNHRILGYAKIYDNGVVRNATQSEIDNFLIAAIDDREQAIADRAKQYFQNHPIERRFLKAIIKELVDVINIERAEHGRPNIEYSQAFTAIINRISKDD